ncbi:cold-shock protein [Luteimonas sp. A478]
MEQGTVVKWVPESGFGFITPDFGGADVFLHVRAFAAPVSIAEGDRVTFKAGVRPGGAYAVEATLTNEVN